jgi:hypothetical protein
MGIVYEINNEVGIAFVVWRGVVGAGDLLDHVRRLTSDPAWPTPQRQQISDLRSASLDASIDQAALEEAVAIFSAHRDKLANLQVAMLTPKEFDKTTTIGRLLIRHGAAVSAFSLPETACRWLGADLDKVNAVLGRMRPSGSLKLD